MANRKEPPRRSLRISLANIFILTLGIAIGFVPFKLWQLRAPAEPLVQIQVQVVEIDHQHLGSLGISPESVAGQGTVSQLAENALREQLADLKNDDAAKTLAAPTLLAVTGQPFSFNSGGEIPVMVTAENGTRSIEFKEFGTRLDATATVLRNGRIRLQLRPELSAIDASTTVVDAEGFSIPSIRSRSIQTEIEVDDGDSVLFGLGQPAPNSLPEKASSPTETLFIARVTKVIPK